MTMGNEKLLDKNQRTLAEKFPEGWLSDQNHVNALIDWADFYKHNIHRFAEHYLGLKLYPYQRLMLYELGNADESVCIAARAAAKSYVIAIFACCEAILRPKSQIVIASGTLKQAKLIVSEKIEKELMPSSPNLRAEIKSIKTRGDDIEVMFRNESSIVVVVGNDNARGYRSTILILEECRMIKKFVIDSVLSKFQHVRNAPYKDRPEYQDIEPEESKTIYISSAWYRSHWMWKLIKDMAMQVSHGNMRYSLLAFDYVITLYHKIKTRNQMIKDKRRDDPTTWMIESENIMVGENENAYFDYEMLAATQVLKQPPIYPRRNDYNPIKKGDILKHQDGEIRIMSCDMAFVDKKDNDNSVFSIIRLIPEYLENGSMYYQKHVVYMEHIHGGDTMQQARRIKTVFYDTGCDYIVLDMRNGGVAIYDMLARPTYDESSQTEMPAWKCMNDENTAARVRVESAEPVLFAVNATAKLNSEIAQITRREFAEHRMQLLAQYEIALDEILPKIKGYADAIEVDTQMFYEGPFLETRALINEMISLTYDRMPDTGIIRISEQGKNTKDRYTSVSYGVYFASLLEHDLLSTSNQYEYRTLVN